MVLHSEGPELVEAPEVGVGVVEVGAEVVVVVVEVLEEQEVVVQVEAQVLVQEVEVSPRRHHHHHHHHHLHLLQSVRGQLELPAGELEQLEVQGDVEESILRCPDSKDPNTEYYFIKMNF